MTSRNLLYEEVTKDVKFGINGHASVIYWHFQAAGFMYLKLEDNPDYRKGLKQLGKDVFVGKIKDVWAGEK